MGFWNYHGSLLLHYTIHLVNPPHLFVVDGSNRFTFTFRPYALQPVA